MSTATPPAREPEPARARVELIAGVALIAIAAVFILSAGTGSMDWLFPLALAWLLVAVGVYLVIRGLLGFGETVRAKPALLRGEGVDVAIFTGIAVIYVVLARPIGFWLASAAMLFLSSIYLAVDRDRRTYVYSAVVAVAVCVVSYVLLLHVFYVPLPRARWLPF